MWHTLLESICQLKEADMQIDIRAIAQKLIDNQEAEQLASKLRIEGIAMLYHEIQKAITEAEQVSEAPTDGGVIFDE